MSATTIVQPDAILKQLGKAWVKLGEENSHSEGVLRACAMTLIVVVGENDDPRALDESLADLIHEHPSRVIVLRVCCPQEDQLRADVSVRCWIGRGKGRELCAEQIEIAASPSRFADVPKIVLGLMVPDLPVALWIRKLNLFDYPEVEQLFSLPDKIIVDSAQMAGNEDGVRYVQELVLSGRNFADLEWTRITPLRQMVAQIFEDEQNRKQLNAIDHLDIRHEGAVVPVCARYLGMWIERSLRRPIEISYTTGDASAGVESLTLRGQNFEASIERQGSCTKMTVNGLVSMSALPPDSDFALLHEELSVMEPDAVFRRSLG